MVDSNIAVRGYMHDLLNSRFGNCRSSESLGKLLRRKRCQRLLQSSGNPLAHILHSLLGFYPDSSLFYRRMCTEQLP